jgi:hypothetical protein
MSIYSRQPRRLSLKQTKAANDVALKGYAALGTPTAQGREEMARIEQREIQRASAPPRKPRDTSQPSEHSLQCTVKHWWRKHCHLYDLPEHALFAIPNGGSRDPIQAARLKAEGVERGVYDLMMPVPRGTWHGLFIEMKAHNGRVSEDQKDFGAFVQRQGYKQSVEWSSESAIAAIKDYLSS